MKIICLLFIIAGLPFFCLGQTGDNSDILTERVVDRPLTIHAGQLQINPGYQLTIGSKQYDIYGDKLDLAKEATAQVRHLYDLEIKYGIIEYLEITAALNYSKMGVREQQNWYFHRNERVYVTELSEYRGLSDLFLGLAFRLPFDIPHFGFSISAGASLPIANYEPDKPTHSSISRIDSTGIDRNIRFHFNNKNGMGTFIYQFGAGIQFFTDKFAITGLADYSLCGGEVKTITWESRLYVDEFTYQSVPCKTKPGNTFSFSIQFDYQAINWFAIFGRFIGMMGSGGWDEEQGVKIGHHEKNLMSVGIGYEIQVARHLRLFQSMDLPVSGKNQLAPLMIYTGASFNFLTR